MQSHDSFLESGKGGPNDDNEPVDCPTCDGCGYGTGCYGTGRYFPVCELCDGSGLVNRETAEAMQEREEPNGD